jgi:hypothetical protein
MKRVIQTISLCGRQVFISEESHGSWASERSEIALDNKDDLRSMLCHRKLLECTQNVLCLPPKVQNGSISAC